MLSAGRDRMARVHAAPAPREHEAKEIWEPAIFSRALRRRCCLNTG
jgi:hypothetical protein